MVTVFTRAIKRQQPVRQIADERLSAGALVSPRDRGASLALELRNMSCAWQKQEKTLTHAKKLLIKNIKKLERVIGAPADDDTQLAWSSQLTLDRPWADAA